MRRARLKSPDEAFYHIFTRVAGSSDYFPLLDPEAWQKLLEIIRFYVSAYCCQLAAFQIMGNHYHLIVFFEAFRPLSPPQLRHRASLLYGHRAPRKTFAWSPQAWQKFNHKLFDVSALMQHINGEYAKWFNRRFDRHGHLWADRFKNPQLLDPKALQECLLYVELNALRAGLVPNPELWKPGSAWLRCHHQDHDLMPLETLFSAAKTDSALTTYRTLLYQRAGLPLPSTHPPHSSALFLSRHRFFTDGLAIGNLHSVSQLLKHLQTQETYRHRKKPIAQLGGFLFTLREQRSHTRT